MPERRRFFSLRPSLTQSNQKEWERGKKFENSEESKVDEEELQPSQPGQLLPLLSVSIWDGECVKLEKRFSFFFCKIKWWFWRMTNNQPCSNPLNQILLQLHPEDWLPHPSCWSWWWMVMFMIMRMVMMMWRRRRLVCITQIGWSIWKRTVQ